MKKKIWAVCMMVLMMIGSMAQAKPIQNPDGSMPLVHWAILESKDGQMDTMMAYGAQFVAPYAEKEAGTYALYGGVDKNQPNLLRLLEIYEDEAAYQLHRSSDGFKQYLKAREDILVRLDILEVDPFVLEAKTSGTGTVVRMARLEIDPTQLVAYKDILKEEMIASVDVEPGVLALLATTEKDQPHVFHLLEIYQDDAAYAAHLQSPHFQKYATLTKTMVVGKNLIEHLPTKIQMTGKPAFK